MLFEKSEMDFETRKRGDRPIEKRRTECFMKDEREKKLTDQTAIRNEPIFIHRTLMLLKGKKRGRRQK